MSEPTTPETSGGRLAAALAGEPDAAPAAQGGKPARATEQAGPDRTAAIRAKYVAAANAAKGGSHEPEADDADPAPADGKFLPGSKKPADAAAKPDDKPKEGEAKPKDGAEVPASIARARRLAQEGKIAEVLELVGLDPEKLTSSQWSAFRHEVKSQKADIAKQREELDRGRAEVQQFARALTPLVQARQAYEAGDYESALKLAFGDDVSAFNRKNVAKLQGTSVDPQTRTEIQQLRQQIEAERQHRAQLEQQAQQRHQSELVEQHKTAIREAVQGLDDPRFNRVVGKRAFIERIFAIQQENWDGHATLPEAEAAELAWDELYGDVADLPAGGTGASSGSQRDRGAQTTRQPAGAVTPARRAVKAATNLNSSEAAEAAPAPKLRGKQLRDFYVRQAEAALMRENGIG